MIITLPSFAQTSAKVMRAVGVAHDDSRVARLEGVGRRVEHRGGGFEQLTARVLGGHADGGADRRGGHRAPGVAGVGKRLGVADDRTHVGELRAEDSRRRSGRGPFGRRCRGPACRRGRRWSRREFIRTSAYAGGPPPVGQTWAAMPRPTRTRFSVACLRSSGFRLPASGSIRTPSPLPCSTREGCCPSRGDPGPGVALREVLLAKRDGIDLQFPRERVHGAFETERALHVSRAAERRHAARVDVREGLLGADVRAGVHLVIDLAGAAFPAADAERDVDARDDRRERAVRLARRS